MVVATQVNVGGVWKDVSNIYVNVGGVWKEVDEVYSNVSAVWETVYILDVVNLQGLFGEEQNEDGGGATATVRMYDGEPGDTYRAGEGWETIEGANTYSHDIVFPGTSADFYQLKWEPLSGDLPDSYTVNSGIWHPLSSGNFVLEWDTPGEGTSVGDVTVSIRKGTGSVLDTATWGGQAESFLEEK